MKFPFDIVEHYIPAKISFHSVSYGLYNLLLIIDLTKIEKYLQFEFAVIEIIQTEFCTRVVIIY